MSDRNNNENSEPNETGAPTGSSETPEKKGFFRRPAGKVLIVILVIIAVLIVIFAVRWRIARTPMPLDVVQPTVSSEEEPAPDEEEAVSVYDEESEEDETDTVDRGADEEDFADSWEQIQAYGFEPDDDYSDADFYSDEYLYSPLSFSLEGEVVSDTGDTYLVKAVFNKPLLVPDDLQPGESCTVVMDELTGETDTLTCLPSDGSGMTYYQSENDGWQAWLVNPSDGQAELYSDSADRVDVPFYEGVLCINKDAVTGAAITNGPYTTVTTSDLMQEDWFNVVAFDSNGHVVQLIWSGD